MWRFNLLGAVPMPHLVTLRSKLNLAYVLFKIDSRCDGGIKRDYVGFTKEDALYYKTILSEHDNEEDLANWMFDGFAWNAFYRLRKYAGQLENYGIDYWSLKPVFEWRG
jgi:hypothetical protein